MTGTQGLAAAAGMAVGASLCLVLARTLVPRAPDRLVRQNYRNERLGAILGVAVVGGGLVALGIAALVDPAEGPGSGDLGWAVAAILVLLGAGGAADDLRGDERAKGFSGHLKAAARGRITGGFLKIVAGGAAGLIAAWLVSSGRELVEIALLVALTANLLNLFDRAPGRATKVALATALPLVLFGPAGWVVATAGLWAAAAAALPADLGERAMLGDGGANPLGGVLGLGLGVALAEPLRLVALVLVLGLNLASERWSFSRVIEGNPILARLDASGRVHR